MSPVGDGHAALGLERHRHRHRPRQVGRRVEARVDAAVGVERQHPGADRRRLRGQHPQLIRAARRRRRQIRCGEHQAARAAPEGARGGIGRHRLTGEIDARQVRGRQHQQRGLRVGRGAPHVRHLALARFGAQRRLAQSGLESRHAAAQLQRVTAERDRERDRSRRGQPADMHRDVPSGESAQEACAHRRCRLGRRRQMSQRHADECQTAHFSRAEHTGRKMHLEQLPFGRCQRSQHVGCRLVAELFVHSHNRSYGAHIRRDGPRQADPLRQHRRRQVLFRRDDEDDLRPFLGPELAMIGVGVGVHEVAGPETPAAGEDAPRDDETLFGAAVMVRRESACPARRRAAASRSRAPC